MLRSIILATSNPGKILLFKNVFRCLDPKLPVLSLAEVGCARIPVEESGGTPEENAMIKARAYWHKLGGKHNVFADDAGLEVDALAGEPGVQTRRWNGRFPDDISDEKWLDYLLERLDGVPLVQRTARWISGWALIDDSGRTFVHRVISPFRIAERRIRPMQPGFPMSAVILYSEQESSEQRLDRLVAEFNRWGLNHKTHIFT